MHVSVLLYFCTHVRVLSVSQVVVSLDVSKYFPIFLSNITNDLSIVNVVFPGFFSKINSVQ